MQATGHALGFVNPALYQPFFSDRTDYLTTFGEDATLSTAPGYDDTTGLGAPTPAFVTSFPRS